MKKYKRPPIDPYTYKIQGEPDGDGGIRCTEPERLRVPSVVIRTDGRYGVAYPKAGTTPRQVSLFDHPALSEMGWRQIDAVLGRSKVDTSGTSGWFHEPATHATREEAQKRAWAAARELGGDIADWP